MKADLRIFLQKQIKSRYWPIYYVGRLMGNCCPSKMSPCPWAHWSNCSDRNQWTPTPRSAHSQNTQCKMKGFCLYSRWPPSLLTWVVEFHCGSRSAHWPCSCAIMQEGNSGMLGKLRPLLYKVHLDRRRQGFLKERLFFAFCSLYKNQKQFPKLKWNLFVVFIFSFKRLRNLMCLLLLMIKLWELNVLWAIMWDNKGKWR